MPQQEDLQAKIKQLEEKITGMERERSKTSPGKFEEFLSNSSQQEKIKSMKSLNEDLKTKVGLLKQKNFDLENSLKDKHLQLLEQKQEHEKEKDVLRKDGKKQLTSLRLDFQDHRERSLTLLQEKDDEIHKLRNQIELAVEESFYSPDKMLKEKSVSPLQVRKSILISLKYSTFCDRPCHERFQLRRWRCLNSSRRVAAARPCTTSRRSPGRTWRSRNCGTNSTRQRRA